MLPIAHDGEIVSPLSRKNYRPKSRPTLTEHEPTLAMIIALGLMATLGPVAIDMYLPALPDIGSEMGASASTMQLTLAGTLFGLGIGQLIVGPLSDSLGRKRPLIVGICVNIAASTLAVFAPTIGVLGIARVFQGLGAAAAAVISLAMVRDLYSGRTVAVMLSRLLLVIGAAPLLAPSIGGAILTVVDWRGIFVVLGLIGILTLLVALFYLPESLPVGSRQPLAFRSILSTYRVLLGDRQFSAFALAAGCGIGAMFSYVSGSSFAYQEEYGLGEQSFAVVFSIGALALILASQINIHLLRRWTPRTIATAAVTAGSLIGTALITLSATDNSSLIIFGIVVWFLIGTVGFLIPNVQALALSLHPDSAGSASALLGALQFGLGAAIAPVVGAMGGTGLAIAIAMTGCIALAMGLILTLPNDRKNRRTVS
ncbi:Bcr/CflA family drug resistance efflux transporter [Williamsia sp. 1138]|uniref:multidrug effflux MFS transporter n=1 Tax=Williamsia sp. 1138 TaxID=1903117 RepID=UPI000A1096B4|nr:multidrug effflux MFS transporter [Williamsia sp. 1138]OZG26090.1 Bcr/CflA family drug resistance efflux transporter [Williamsia sp. 1138]